MFFCCISSAEWELLDNDNTHHFYDKSTIYKYNKTTEMWTMMEYSKKVGLAKSIKTLYLFDCKTRLSALKAYVQFSGMKGTGTIVSSYMFQEKSLQWEPVAAYSFQEKMWERACENNKRF